MCNRGVQFPPPEEDGTSLFSSGLADAASSNSSSAGRSQSRQSSGTAAGYSSGSSQTLGGSSTSAAGPAFRGMTLEQEAEKLRQDLLTLQEKV